MVEIKVAQWDPEDPRNAKFLTPEAPELCPIFGNEIKKCYFRNNGGSKKSRLTEIADLAKLRLDIAEHDTNGSCESEKVRIGFQEQSVEKLKSDEDDESEQVYTYEDEEYEADFHCSKP